MYKFFEGALIGLLLAIVFAFVDKWSKQFDEKKRSIINFLTFLLLMFIGGCGFVLFNF